jgi:hypothetical protein
MMHMLLNRNKHYAHSLKSMVDVGFDLKNYNVIAVEFPK